MAELQAVVFDLDGTLVDSLEDIAGAVNRVLTDLGRPCLSVEDYRPLVGWGLRQLVVSVTMEAPLAPDELEQAYQTVLKIYRAHPVVASRPYAGIADAVSAISKKFPVAVLSNKEDEVTKAVVSTLFPSIPFRSVQGARPGVPHKPDPRALLSLIADWGVPASATAFLGDSEVDVQTALSAGCVPLGAGWGFRSPEDLKAAGAVEVFSTPADFFKFIL